MQLFPLKEKTYFATGVTNGSDLKFKYRESGCNLDGYNHECELWSILKTWEIDFKILRLLPGQLLKATQFAPDCLILETNTGKLALWIHRGQEATLASQSLLLKISEMNGVKNFLYPLPLTDDRTYAPLDGRRWFYITEWPDSRRILFSNHNDLKLLIDLLLELRKILQRTGVSYFMTDRKEKTNLLYKFSAIRESLNFFTMLAKYRLKPTNFDNLFLEYYVKAILQVEQAYKILVESEYQSLVAGITGKDLVINRLVRNNLRISPESYAICLRCRDFRQDLPIIDLGTLMVKAGRSLQWNCGWFQQMISQYQRYFPIDRTERKVLLALLTCPWSFYRLAARYYFNRAEWSIGTYIERLERILGDEPKRMELVEAMHY